MEEIQTQPETSEFWGSWLESIVFPLITISHWFPAEKHQRTNNEATGIFKGVKQHNAKDDRSSVDHCGSLRNLLNSSPVD